MEKSVTRLGPEKTKAMLEIAETMKYHKPELKKILVKFVTVNADEGRKEIAFHDYIASLVELAHLLGKDNDSDNVLFYTLYQGFVYYIRGEEEWIKLCHCTPYHLRCDNVSCHFQWSISCRT